MANTFKVGATVICSITVKDTVTLVLQDPVTSMKVVIDRKHPTPANVITSTDMVNDAGDGAFHYDYDSVAALKGEYEVIYTAIDGTRTSKGTDKFVLE